jgi:hypothetical protein
VTTRRDFLQHGLVASALLTGTLARLPAGAAELARPRLERFVFDGRFGAAVQAARLAAAAGIPLAETADDLTALWYHDLDLRWRRAPMALAGVTTKGALFVLETLAMDRGMRVLYRGAHGAAGPGRAPVHALEGRADLLADLLPPELASRSPAAAERDEVLFSWLIAPRSAVAAAA